MPVLTVRISEKEKALLVKRSKQEGVSAGEFVRRLLNEAPIYTAGELLDDMNKRLGDKSLRIRRRK